MTGIDFLFSIVVIIGIVFFAITYAANVYSTEFDAVKVSKLEVSASTLSRQLFETQNKSINTVSLMANFNEVKGLFKEIGGQTHSEQLVVFLSTPDANKVHVYDKLFNEIPSTVDQVGSRYRVRFRADFTPLEQKIVNIIYSGAETSDVQYGSDPSQVNVTAVILSSQPFPLVSDDRCNEMKNANYDDVKRKLAAENSFRIELQDCDFGPSPPTTNIVIKSAPLYKEDPTGLITAKVARVFVW